MNSAEVTAPGELLPGRCESADPETDPDAHVRGGADVVLDGEPSDALDPQSRDKTEATADGAPVFWSFDDGPPTEIMTTRDRAPPEQVREDPILDDDIDLDDVPDTEEVDIQQVAASVNEEPESSTSEGSRPLERLRKSAAAQLILLTVVGAAALFFMFSGPSGPDAPQRPARQRGTFPTIEIEGAPPVTEKDIERRMRMPPKDGVESSDDKIRKELKAIAALGRKAAGVDPLPERAAPGRKLAKLDEEAIHSDSPIRREDGRSHAGASLARHFYAPGGTVKVEGASEERQKNRLPLPVGARLFAKLEVGISSGHPTAVLARLTKEIRAEGRLVAAKGAMLRGSFAADGDKIYATFSELLLDGGQSLEFEGYAVDQKVPGLLATRREIGDGDPGTTIVQDTMEVAKGVVRSVTSGSIVGHVAQGVADGVLPEQRATQASKVILEVAAGKRFQIVVTKGGRT